MSPEDVEKLRQSDMAGVVVGKGEEGEGEEKKKGDGEQKQNEPVVNSAIPTTSELPTLIPTNFL